MCLRPGTVLELIGGRATSSEVPQVAGCDCPLILHPVLPAQHVRPTDARRMRMSRRPLIGSSGCPLDSGHLPTVAALDQSACTDGGKSGCVGVRRVAKCAVVLRRTLLRPAHYPDG